MATNRGAVSPAVNGTRSEMNNFTIDGVENNELYFNFVALDPPPHAIREFKVQSDMSGGAFGRSKRQRSYTQRDQSIPRHALGISV
ncbi:MAG TPA: hypothetical protein VFA90_17730 [Terriglobales bacterium]|nr:hypothetical protein [Terriglobales bacterium]